MAAIPFAEAGNAIIKKSPRKGGFYLARPSFEKGVTPKHLEGYAGSMAADARACATATAGMKGNARVTAMNGCIASKRRK